MTDWITPPQLSDALLGIYIQIVLVLLIFGLGIPLALSTAIPDYVRRLLLRYHERLIHSYYILMATYIAILLFFIWVLHSCPGIPSALWKDWLSVIIVTTTIIGTVVYWWYLFRQNPVNRIIAHLENKLSNIVTIGAQPINPILDDLVFLATQSPNEGELEEVLQCYKNTIFATCHNREYKGFELEPLIRALERSAIGSETIMSDSLYKILADILKTIKSTHRDRCLRYEADNILATKILIQFAVRAIGSRLDSTTLHFLNACRDNSRFHFEIGLAALERQKYGIAIAAFDNLHAMLDRNDNLPDSRHSCLGLLAHFWNNEGQTQREFAEIRWRKLSKSNGLAPSPKTALREAKNYFYSNCEFETANNLAATAAGLNISIRNDRS